MVKKILWAIVVVALLVTAPTLIERTKVEKANNFYKIVVPYGQIEEMGRWLSMEEALAQLRAEGLETVSIEPVNLLELEKKEFILEVARNYLVGNYPDQIDRIPEGGGMYFRVVKEHPLLPRIFEVFDREYQLIAEQLQIPFQGVQAFEVAGADYLFVPSRNDLRLDSTSQNVVQFMKEKALGYDFAQIELLAEQGFSILPRVPNQFNFVDTIYDHFIIEELQQLRNYGDQILFLGTEAPGFPEPAFLAEFAQFLKEQQFNVLTIEGTEQKGLGTLLNFDHLNENVIRLFSIPTKGKGFEGDVLYVNQTIRALHERNIRVLFFNPLRTGQTYVTAAEAKLGLEGTKLYINSVQNSSRNSLTYGNPDPYQQLVESGWLKAATYAGGFAFVLLFFLQISNNRYLITLGAAGFAVVLAAQYVTDHYLLMKAIVLFVALVGPVYAIISVKQVNGWLSLIARYFYSAMLALISAWFVVSVLYGTNYLVKLDGFTGVKLLSIVPTLAVAVITIQRRATSKEFLTSVKRASAQLLHFLKGAVTYWHIILLAVVGIGIYFYLGRTGNQGILLPGEAFARQWLEESFSARPRTTEFLIGFPLFALGLYGMMQKKKWAAVALIFGALGFSSMVGTFTHLHTPLLVSVLRTINGLVIGLAFGLVLIVVVSFLERKWQQLVKGRLRS